MTTALHPQPHLWFGGSPCSGKSTAAETLSRRHGLVHYKCDDHFDAHLTRGHDDELPACRAVKHGSTDEIFLRSPAENLALAWDLYDEMFRYILEDVSRLPGPVIVEGTQLQPSHLAALGIPASRVFYLVPTEPFQRHHYSLRTWAPSRVADSANPPQALNNWMTRDAAYARRIAEEAAPHGYPVLWVDGSLTPEATCTQIERHWLKPAQRR